MLVPSRFLGQRGGSDENGTPGCLSLSTVESQAARQLIERKEPKGHGFQAQNGSCVQGKNCPPALAACRVRWSQSVAVRLVCVRIRHALSLSMIHKPGQCCHLASLPWSASASAHGLEVCDGEDSISWVKHRAGRYTLASLHGHQRTDTARCVHPSSGQVQLLTPGRQYTLSMCDDRVLETWAGLSRDRQPVGSPVVAIRSKDTARQACQCRCWKQPYLLASP